MKKNQGTVLSGLTFGNQTVPWDSKFLESRKLY